MREYVVTRAQSIQVYVTLEHLNVFLWLSNGFPLNLVFRLNSQYFALITGKANVQIRHFSSIFSGKG